MINSLSVIIPVHNEVQNIRINLSKIYDKLSKYDFDFEIIIIDSESKDGSSEELKKFREFKKIKVINEDNKSGWGSAVKKALKIVEKKFVVFFPIDNQYKIDSIIKICLENNTSVITYRGNQYINLIRYIRSIAYKKLCKLLFKLDFKEINSIKILNFEEFKKDINFNSLPDDWFFELELLKKMKQKKIPFTEKPIELHKREIGQSTIGFLDSFKMLIKLFRIYFRD